MFVFDNLPERINFDVTVGVPGFWERRIIEELNKAIDYIRETENKMTCPKCGNYADKCDFSTDDKKKKIGYICQKCDPEYYARVKIISRNK